MSCSDGTWLCWLYNWQTLIAGLLGAEAAIIVITITLLTERRRRTAEIGNLRAGLGAEIRIIMHWMLATHSNLKECLTDEKVFRWQDLEWAVSRPSSAVFPRVTSQIGAFGASAARIVLFYHALERFDRNMSEVVRGEPASGPVPLPKIAAVAGKLISMVRNSLLLLDLLTEDGFQGFDGNLKLALNKAIAGWAPYEDHFHGSAEASSSSRSGVDLGKI